VWVVPSRALCIAAMASSVAVMEEEQDYVLKPEKVRALGPGGQPQASACACIASRVGPFWFRDSAKRQPVRRTVGPRSERPMGLLLDSVTHQLSVVLLPLSLIALCGRLAVCYCFLFCRSFSFGLFLAHAAPYPCPVCFHCSCHRRPSWTRRTGRCL